MSESRTLFLIDGSNQMYRAYHAIRGLTGPDGRSTNAVYGFVTMLRKLLADHHPAYIAASFDLPRPTFRDAARRRLQGQPRADAATTSPSRFRWCTRPARRSACRSSRARASRPTT